MQRRTREHVSWVVAIVCFAIVAVLLAGLAWMVLRGEDVDGRELGAQGALVAT